MKLASSRSLEELRPVLKDPNSSGPDPVYWVFSEVDAANKWLNMTVISTGRLGNEFPKTFGHYHGDPIPEIYQRVGGQGILVLQKKHFEHGIWVPEKVEEVLLVKTLEGDEITVTAEYGHSWSNSGDVPLIFFDNWKSRHSPSEYEMIKELAGLAYYLVDDNGPASPAGRQPKAVPNPNYVGLPEPIWLTAEQYRLRERH